MAFCERKLKLSVRRPTTLHLIFSNACSIRRILQAVFTWLRWQRAAGSDEPTRTGIERHLARCADCAAALDEAQEMLGLLTLRLREPAALARLQRRLSTEAKPRQRPAVLMFVGPIEEKRFVDVEENAVYWYFVVIAWLPIWGVIYWAPRLL